MKKTLLSSMILAICTLFLLASCDDGKKPDGQITPDDAAIILPSTEIDVPYETLPDYDFQIIYKLQNVSEDAKISVTNYVDWIYDLDYSKKGEINFKVLRNETSEIREAILTITCPGIESVDVTVRQEAGVPYAFDIEIRNVTKTALEATIYPLDKEAAYVSFIADSAMMVNSCPGDEDIYQRDMAYFENEASKNACTVEEILEKCKLTGDKDIAVNTLNPNTSYLIYAYHINPATLEMTSEIVRKYIHTQSVAMIDVKFNITSDVKGTHIDATYSPVNYDGWYFREILQGLNKDASEQAIVDGINSTYLKLVSMYHMFGMTDEQILLSVAVKGEQKRAYDLNANSFFINFAAALDEDAMMCSVPSYEKCETGNIDPSDNQLTITVTDIKAQSANVHVTATNQDQYTIFVMNVPYWEETIEGKTDKEIKELLAKNVRFKTTGDIDQVVTGLEPETDYIVIAMGYDAGTYTTDLFKANFTTTEIKRSDARISMSIDGFYSMDEVADLDKVYGDVFKEYIGQGGYVFPFFIKVEPSEGAKVWYGFWNADDIENNPQATDENIINSLMQKEPEDAGDNYHLGISHNGDNIIFTVLAQDGEGGMTELWKSDVLHINKSEAGDAKYFVDNYPWPYGTESTGIKSCSLGSVATNELVFGNLESIVEAESECKTVGEISFVDEFVQIPY